MNDTARGERLQIMLTQDELEALDNWRFERRMPSRAAALFGAGADIGQAALEQFANRRRPAMHPSVEAPVVQRFEFLLGEHDLKPLAAGGVVHSLESPSLPSDHQTHSERNGSIASLCASCATYSINPTAHGGAREARLAS